MSTARVVPETRGMEQADAWDVLRRNESRALARDTVTRLRMADGFSHGRALAFQAALTLLPGAIVLVALSALLHWDGLRSAIAGTIEAIAPGSTSDVFLEAFHQGESAGKASNWAAITAGIVAVTIAGTTAFGQLERAANRIYGIERDRPTLHKYGRGFVLLVTAGVLVTLSFLAIGPGSHPSGDGIAHTAWQLARWPLGAVLLTAAYLLVFRLCPARRQPELPWLLVGALVAAGLSMLVSVLLAVYLAGSGTFGDTYGPLAGFIGVLLWAYAGAIALFAGLALSAQVEALRAGDGAPASEAKRELGEADLATPTYGAALLATDHGGPE